MKILSAFGVESDVFAATHWSVVVAAGRNDSDPENARSALAQLCQTYWSPLYAFVRSRGYSLHDAQDFTQSFFVHLIEKRIYARADRSKGKFRTFLLAALRNFLADSLDREQALKRGGGYELLSIDETEVSELEAGLHEQFKTGETPDEDRVFERTWAETVVRSSLENLSRTYEAEGNNQIFQELKVFLTGGAPLPSYAELARQMGIQESTLRSHVTRLRTRYREVLRTEVRRTVARESDVEPELRELLRVLTSR